VRRTGWCLVGLALLLAVLPPALRAQGKPATPLAVAAPESLEMYGPLVAAVLQDAGIQPALSFYPTARSRALFVSGAADAEFFRIANLPPDYPSDVILIGPLQTVRFGLFIRAGDARLSGKPADFLWQQSLAYVRGTLAVEGLLKSKQIKAEGIERSAASKMLLAGRMDVLIDSERLLLTHLMESKTQDQISLAATVLEEPTFLLLAGRHKALEPAIRQALQRWMESGRWQREYQAINQQNGLPPGMSLVKWPGR
jgi:hypothetical protein